MYSRKKNKQQQQQKERKKTKIHTNYGQNEILIIRT